MSDLLVELSANPSARRLIKTLGLPLPMPEPLRRAKGPWEARPLDDATVVFGAATGSSLAGVVAEALAGAGADTHVIGDESTAQAFRAPGEAYGRPAKRIEQGTPVDLRPSAVVFDGTGIDSPERLVEAYEFFHPLATKLARSGRMLVLARTQEGLSPAAAAAQAGLEGFVRSAGKELGRNGSTANIVHVEPGAEPRVEAVLRFLLSARSAFVTGQPFRVSALVAGEARAPVTRVLEGRTVLVTGAARGIGEATAKLLAAEGARVVCLDRPADDGPTSQLARQIDGGVLLADMADPGAPAHIAKELRERFSGVDVVVHNAGVTRDKTLARMSREQWDQVLAINLGSVVRTTDVLLREGVLRDGGRIVCLSSIAGLAGNMGQTNYAASKAGIVGYVRALAQTVASRGIAVNAVAPGFIETRLTAAVPIAIREAGRRMSSLRQGGMPRDVGEVITFLSSPGALGLTGQVVRVCGQSLLGA